MFHSEHLQEKWAPLLDHEGGIKDSHRRAVTAVLLENQEKFLHEQNAFGSSGLLNEAPTNASGSDGFQGGSAEAGPTAGFDPVLISLIRRSMPNLIAYDLLVRVCVPTTLRTLTARVQTHSTRWHSQSRKSPLPLSPEL